MLNNTKRFLTITIVSIFTLLVLAVLNIPNNFQSKPGTFESIQHPTQVEGILAGCGAIYEFDPPEAWYGTIPSDYVGEIPTQPMLIPAYGYMDSEPFGLGKLGAYPPQFEGFSHETTLRALWDGVTIIYYDKSIDKESYRSVADYVTDRIQEGQRMILTPYTIKEKDIPLGRLFAFANWSITQSCETFDLSVFQTYQKFVDNNTNQPNGGTPPQAPLNPDGKLNPISPTRGTE